MPLHVHLLHAPEAEHLADLQARLDGGIRLTAGDKIPSEVQILVAGRPRRPHLEASPHLHTVVIPWAGVPPETRQLLREFPHLAVHNLHHNDAMTAESALALLLAATKLLIPMDRRLREHDWRPRYRKPNPAVLLEGKTVLILGYGAIGRRVGRACRALGMQVRAVRRDPGAPTLEEAEVYPPQDLPALLPRAHVLMVTLPLTEETEGLIGEKELALLPDGAVLVNVGRGAIVDQGALYRALKGGKLHSAGIDVWYNYPQDEAARASTPPADYPFHELDNAVMSPHRAGASLDSERLRMAALADLLNAAARGRPLPNRVDLEAGY